MKKTWLEVIGWYGVLAILAAYALAAFDVMTTDQLAYIVLNLTGSIAVAAIALSRHDTQPAVLNIIWAAIALFGLIQLWF